MSSLRRSALLFTLARFGLFIVMALLIWSGTGAVGHQLNGFPLLLAALLVSSMVGLFLFSRQRQQFAEALAAQRDAKTAQLEERRARLEDEGI